MDKEALEQLKEISMKYLADLERISSKVRKGTLITGYCQIVTLYHTDVQEGESVVAFSGYDLMNLLGNVQMSKEDIVNAIQNTTPARVESPKNQEDIKLKPSKIKKDSKLH